MKRVTIIPAGSCRGFSTGQLLLLLIAMVTVAMNNGMTLAQEGPEWKELFNGKDLDDWRANMRPESFSVTDGTLRAHGKNGMAHLFYAPAGGTFHSFKDFEMEVVARGEPNSNSGIFFHTGSELRKGKYLNKGYEVQLNSTQREPRKTGSLYGIIDLPKSPVDETRWFTLRFRVQGRHVQVWINDQEVLDYTEPDAPERSAARAQRLIDPAGGAIALQAHDPKSVFYFRRIRIRELGRN